MPMTGGHLTNGGEPRHDQSDAARGVTYQEWPESPGSMKARQPIREAHRGNGAPARCDRSNEQP
jgi:hypothetical protein